MQRTQPHDNPAIVAIIRAAADRHGVPRQVALAFAWCESHLIASAEGDTSWHLRNDGALYRVKVLDNPRFRSNPARNIPHVWHSYGLYQLLACYHAQPDEDPRALLRPELNAERGVLEIGRLLHLARGDARAARLKYVGCGFSGSNCADAIATRYVDKLARAMERYRSEVTS
jgi:hypothetical protein